MTQYGYMRVSKHDGSQVFDLQYDSLRAAGVAEKDIYEDRMSGRKEHRPGLDACFKAIHRGDVLVVWKLDRLGRSTQHLVKVVNDLTAEGIGVHVLTGMGGPIDTTTANGKLLFNIFATLAEFEADLIRERTVAGLAAARARGRKGGRPRLDTSSSKVAMAKRLYADKTNTPSAICKTLNISRATLYRYVNTGGGNVAKPSRTA